MFILSARRQQFPIIQLKPRVSQFVQIPLAFCRVKRDTSRYVLATVCSINFVIDIIWFQIELTKYLILLLSYPDLLTRAQNWSRSGAVMIANSSWPAITSTPRWRSWKPLSRRTAKAPTAKAINCVYFWFRTMMRDRTGERSWLFNILLPIISIYCPLLNWAWIWNSNFSLSPPEVVWIND